MNAAPGVKSLIALAAVLTLVGAQEAAEKPSRSVFPQAV
jgi:hypothetical protein